MQAVASMIAIAVCLSLVCVCVCAMTGEQHAIAVAPVLLLFAGDKKSV
jgi:hypothetical protein